MQAGQREHGFERSELLAAAPRNPGDSGFDPRNQPRQIVIANRHAIDLKPLVDAIQMRRGEQSGSQAVGAADAGAERRRAALAVRSRHHHRNALQPCAIDRERVEQLGHPRQANAVAVFRKVKHSTVPSPKTCDARSSGSDRPGRILPAAGSTGWRSPRSPASLPGRLRCPVNMSTAATRRPSAPGCLPRQLERGLRMRGFQHHRSPRAQIHPPGNVPAFALGQHGVERGVAVRRGEPAKVRGIARRRCARPADRGCELTPSPSTKGGYFRAE